MLDGEYDKEIEKVNLDYKKLSNLVKDIPTKPKLHKYTNFLIVNATCHSELSNSFRVSLNKLPALAVYDSKFQTFTKMKNSIEFTEENIYNFLIDAVESRAMYRKLNREKVIFKEKDCKAVSKKVKRVDYDQQDNNKYGIDEDDDDDTEELNLPQDEKDEF
jgi:hypothetical protein